MQTPEFWDKDGPTAKLARNLLRPLAWAYGNSVVYKAAHSKPHRTAAKVVCVGNLTVGGTGKTPIAIALAGALLGREQKVCFLTRGYGGKERGPLLVDLARHSAAEVGDEALLLANTAPVIVSNDRAAGARLADNESADVIVMDDGHQNFSVTKDLSLVVIDSEYGFGNGCVLPAGPLREPIEQGLARGDAVVILGDKPTKAPQFCGPILRARLLPGKGIRLTGARVVAFAGIGRPQKFFGTLRNLGAELAATHAFPDHHIYSQVELKRLHRDAAAKNAALITTEKDLVRLPPAQREGIRSLPIGVEFDNASALSDLLDRVASRQLPTSSP